MNWRRQNGKRKTVTERKRTLNWRRLIVTWRKNSKIWRQCLIEWKQIWTVWDAKSISVILRQITFFAAKFRASKNSKQPWTHNSIIFTTNRIKWVEKSDYWNVFTIIYWLCFSNICRKIRSSESLIKFQRTKLHLLPKKIFIDGHFPLNGKFHYFVRSEYGIYYCVQK